MKIRIGAKLAAIREDKKLSQSEISDLLGMSQAAYSRLERGETSLEFARLGDIAEKLQVPVQELLPDTLAINNNNQNTGHGHGYGLIMGNFNYYANKDEVVKDLERENTSLREKMASMQNEINLLREMLELLKSK